MAKAKFIPGLDCEASALEGINLVLRTRFEEMCELRDVALNWTDIEGVHDMRVASRRLRSAMRDFQPYLGHRIPQKRLKAVADALGDVRDQDVAIASLEGLAAESAEGMAGGIEPLTDERRWRRERARTALEKTLREDSLRNFGKKFVERLEHATLSETDSERAGNGPSSNELSLREIGREIILGRLEELRDLSESLYYPLESGALHRMRIAAKKLRYAIELFSPCWGDKLDVFADQTSELQTSLGEVHDCDVWLADLGKRLTRRQKERRDESNGDAESHPIERRAAAWLMRQFVKNRSKHFRDALRKWDEWETTGFSGRLLEALDAPRVEVQLQESSSLTPAEAVSSDLAAAASAAEAASSPPDV
jgi:CHAD domain-containing protein